MAGGCGCRWRMLRKLSAGGVMSYFQERTEFEPKPRAKVLNWERNEAGVGRSEQQTGHYLAAWALKGFLGVTGARLGCVPPKLAPVTSAFLCAAIRSHRQRTQRMATV